MKRITFHTLLFLLLECLSVRAASPLGVPVEIEIRKTNGLIRSDLKWPADGDRQYDVLTTTNLTNGAWMLATNLPIAPTNLIGAFQHSSSNRTQFYRVAQRDITGPTITSRYPATNGIGVGRFAIFSLALTDDTGVDVSRFALSLNNGVLTNGSSGVSVTSNSFQYNPGTNAWGGYGATSAVSFVCADVLGNTTTLAWTFTLEVQPVVTNVLIHLPPPASLKNSALAQAAKKHGANFLEGLAIVTFETNLIVFSYSGTNHGLYPGGILVSHDPARFFYRQITSLTNDTNSHTVTTYTTNVPLTALVRDGTFSPEAFTVVSGANAIPKWTAEGSYSLPFSYASEFTVGQFEIGDHVRITPGVLSINFNGKAEVSCVIKDWQVVQFDASIRSQFAAELRAQVEFLAQAEFVNNSVPLASVPLAYVGGLIGPVPVWVELKLGLDLGVEASAEGAVVFATGLDAYASSEFRMAWRPAGQTESYSGSFNVVPVPLQMEFQVSAEAFLYLKPRLSALVYSLAGVSADYRRGPSVEASWIVGEPQAKISLYDKWELNAGLSIVGVPDGQLPNVTLLQEKRTVQTWYWPEILEQTPEFTRHPASVAALKGSIVTLEATATGGPVPTYQWFQNGKAIPFRTQPTLTFTMGNSAVGSYTVMAKNRVGWVFSNPATVSLQTQPPSPSGMALIPTASFTMGDEFSEGFSNELPPHTVYVSGFYMDRTEVTRALWNEVYAWAITHGYSFDNAGFGKASTHPVQTVSWFDSVKWCNARSEKEGRMPAYYTDAAQTTVYRSGQTNVQNTWVNWSRGYRLPTEAEWEKAARGGTSGQRFPWANAGTITHGRANYFSDAAYPYDVSSTRGYHPTFNDGVYPYTNPVGYFSANANGLFDMAGNVYEWCWDWFAANYYSSSASIDPRGPVFGSSRSVRGAGWSGNARTCRLTYRYGDDPSNRNGSIGFRSVLPASQ